MNDTRQLYLTKQDGKADLNDAVTSLTGCGGYAELCIHAHSQINSWLCRVVVSVYLYLSESVHQRCGADASEMDSLLTIHLFADANQMERCLRVKNCLQLAVSQARES